MNTRLSQTDATPRQLRLEAREGRFDSPTGNLAAGFQQANIVIVPHEAADAFATYVRANAQACPLLAVGVPGDHGLPGLGQDIDIRTDLPRYRIFRDGVAAGDRTDIRDLWRDDLVTFALGCSLGFEAAIAEAGIHLRSFEPGQTCSAFECSIATTRSGPFGGPLIVTMRAVPEACVERVRAITEAHPEAHGGPVHIGDPVAIGVDLGKPVDGIGLTDVRPGEVAMFWACGVTSQRALEHARLALAITHAPAHMLITDVPLGVKPVQEN